MPRPRDAFALHGDRQHTPRTQVTGNQPRPAAERTRPHLSATTPTISVIVIFRDAERFLAEAVGSVFAQSLTDWELVLVDDGSVDGSTAMARALAAKHPARVSYFDHPAHAALGMSESRNLGVCRTSAPCVAFLDADDVWVPEKLEEQLGILERTDAGLVYGRMLIWHSWTGRPEDAARDFCYDLGVAPESLVEPPGLVSQLVENRHQSPTTSGSLLRRDVIQRVGGFATEFPGMYEDQVFFAKVLLSTRTYVSGRCWARYRQHPHSESARFESRVGYHAGRLPYLRWLDAYMRETRATDLQTWRALERELLAARRPRLSGAGRPVAQGLAGVRAQARRRVAARRSRSPAPSAADAGAARPGPAPLVSVVTIFLDAEHFLADAVESVLAQTHEEWELLLVDDGSTDASADIARKYAGRHPGRIRVLAHEGGRNRGKSVARNLGIAAARGRYLAFLDADDVFLPAKLARQVRLLEAHPEAAMVYGPSLYWYGWTGDAALRARDRVAALGVSAGALYDPPTLLTAYLRDGGVVPCTCGLLARTSLIRELGAFDVTIADLFEDQVLLAKICLRHRVYVDGACGDLYRQHEGSTSQAAIRRGRYHPEAPNPAHAAYLRWLAGHIAGAGIRDPDLLRGLGAASFPYRHPKLSSLRARGRRVVRGAAGRFGRVAPGATPPAHGRVEAMSP
jgi:glycosyltransferase involved in cell wall biosynthesis